VEGLRPRIFTSGDSAIVVPIMESDLPNDTTQLSRWRRLVPAKTFRPTLRTDAIGAPTLSEPRPPEQRRDNDSA
jgi:hypothetical protein